jgi:hypothetical protein
VILYALLLGLMSAQPSQAEVDAWAENVRKAKGEPPTPMTVKGVGAERTVAEFMDVCVRPGLDAPKVVRAVETSDFAYKREFPNSDPNSFVWRSNRAFLVVNIRPVQAQCALSVASNQARSGSQLLAMLRPAIEAELGQLVRVSGTAFYLEWTGAQPGFVWRITLAGATDQPSNAIWYILDKTAPGLREKLDAIESSRKAQKE